MLAGEDLVFDIGRVDRVGSASPDSIIADAAAFCDGLSRYIVLFADSDAKKRQAPDDACRIMHV